MKKYGGIIWIAVLASIIAFLAIPQTRALFEEATRNHPYLMGFIKFAILSIMGEFLAVRLVKKRWEGLKGLFWKMCIWGIVGVLIVLMFSLYSAGVHAVIEKGLLVIPGGYAGAILTALYISAIMNLTFGPVFMAFHRFTDTFIDLAADGGKPTSVGVIKTIDWSGFIGFVVGKTIPFFWIPAHTVTFLLPDDYKVLFAASLSIILGLILSYAKLKK